jgi:Mg-chelatase subunit ChlD
MKMNWNGWYRAVFEGSADWQSAVSPTGSRPGAGNSRVPENVERSAGYNPAIRQIENLRYKRRIQCAAWAIALALLSLSPRTSAQEVHDNVVIVLDASGSMMGKLPGTDMTKMDGAKAALKEVLKNVPQSTRVGLLVFSAANLTNDWAYPLGPRNDAELLQAIDRPIPRSGTPLGRYIKKGADRLLEERAKQFGYGTFRLLVVTDGEAEDRALVDRYTPDVVARGLTVDVIGVAMAGTHTLARKVHSYRAANDPASLQRALSEVFAEVGARTDTADADVFALIAPIPSEVATAAIQALATVDNHPIGATPPSAAAKPKAAGTQPSTPAAPQKALSTPPQSAARPMVSNVSSPTPPRRKRSFSMPLLVGIIVVVFLFARRMRRRS